MSALGSTVATIFSIGMTSVAIGVPICFLAKNWRRFLTGASVVATGTIFILLTLLILAAGGMREAFGRDLKTEHLFQRPSLVEAVVQRPLGYAKFAAPFVQVFLDSAKADFNSPDSVLGLISGAGPNTIGSRVALVVLLPLQREALNIGRAHVLVEISEGHPSLANLNSAATVPMEPRVVRIRASRNHSKPNGDQWASVFAGQAKQISRFETPGGFVPHFYLARDDGRYRDNPLRSWFDSLKSGRGPCCSDADGSAVSDVDWESSAGRYRVRIEGQWWDVPEDAVVTEPNRYGRTMVWPIFYRSFGSAVRIEIRCFMPGSMS